MQCSILLKIDIYYSNYNNIQYSYVHNKSGVWM